MGSLKHCLSLHPLNTYDEKKVRAAIKDYRTEGYPGGEANAKGILDYITDLRQVRSGIMDQLKAQGYNQDKSVRGEKEKSEEFARTKPLKIIPAKTLVRIILDMGGVSAAKIKVAGFNVKEDFQQHRLSFVFRKNGRGLDDLASELISSGQILPGPDSISSDDYLLSLLQEAARGQKATVDQLKNELLDITNEQKDDIIELKEDLKRDGYNESQIEEAVRAYQSETREDQISEESDRSGAEARTRGDETDKQFVTELEEPTEVQQPTELFNTSDMFTLSGNQPHTPKTMKVREKTGDDRLVDVKKQTTDELRDRLSGEKAKREYEEGRAGETAGTGKLGDFGEKIGGARKDTAERGFTKATARKKDETSPAWKKRFVAMERIVAPGTWVVFDSKTNRTNGQTFQSQEEAEKAVPLFAVAQQHQVFQEREGEGYAIYKKVGERKRLKIVNRSFPSREEAMKYMVAHAEELLNTKTSFGEEILPVPETAYREGPERRTGNATPEMFMEAFAPRGIEFGNWNNQEERQQVMNHAYDGLLDLADALGIAPKALMLNGELAIAFGARGQGLSGAKAHYEPGYGVINLTKMRGAGSLAHEWLHGFDHYLARLDTKAATERRANEKGDLIYPVRGDKYDFQSHGPSYKTQLRPEVAEAYKTLMDTIYRKAEQYVEDTAQAERFIGKARDNLREHLNDVRRYLASDYSQHNKTKFGKPASAEQLAEFDRLADILVQGGDLETEFRKIETKQVRSKFSSGGRYTNDTLEAINAVMKAVRNRQGFNSEQTGVLDRVKSAMGLYSARIKMLEDAEKGTEKTRKRPTTYAIEAKKMDQARASDYWSTPHEMAARAFAAYVEDKIAEKGGQSDFLVYHAHGGILLPMIDGFIAQPYPEGTEREAINKAFDTFVKTLEAKKTNKGVMLFKKERGGLGINSPEFKAWFGDWEGAQRARFLFSMKPTVIDISAFDDKADMVSFVAAAKDQYRKLLDSRPKTVDNRIVRFTMTRFKETIRHSADRRVGMMTPQLPDLIERAVPLWSEPNTDATKSNVVAYHTYGAPVTFGENEAVAKIVIREDTDGHLYYDSDTTTVELLNNERASESLPPYRKPKAGAVEIEKLSKNRLAQWVKSVKDELVSKIVDEKGAPLIVYHGTTKAIDAFTNENGRNLIGWRDAVGFYFSASAEEASDYALYPANGNPNTGANVVPVYLNLKNPKIVKKIQEISLIDAGQRDQLIKDGYDGVMTADKREIVAFFPSQIKSIYNQGIWSNDDNQISFRETASPATGKYKAANLAKLLNPVISKVESRTGVRVEVVQDNRGFPVDFIERAGSDFDLNTTKVYAAFDPKENMIYLVADNLESTAFAEEVLFEELVGHKGIRSFLGREKMDELRDVVYRQFEDDPAMTKVIRDYELDITKPDDRLMAGDEFIAHNIDRPTLIDRIITFVRNALRDMGFKVRISDKDMRTMVGNLLNRTEAAMMKEEAAEANRPSFKGQPLYRKENKSEVARGLNSLLSALENAEDIPAALRNPDLGDVTLYYGGKEKDEGGLLHIIAERKAEGSEDIADDLVNIIKAVALGIKTREYGGNIGRADIEYGDYVAILSKSRFGEKETWLLTGFKKKEEGVRGESYNPRDYALLTSGSLSEVVASLKEKIAKELDIVKSDGERISFKRASAAESSSGPPTDDFDMADLMATLAKKNPKYADDLKDVLTEIDEMNLDPEPLGTEQKEIPDPKESTKTTRNWFQRETAAIFRTIAMSTPANMGHNTMLENVLKSPEWYEHPVLKNIIRLFTMDREKIYHTTLLDLITVNDKNVIEETDKLRRKNPEAYKELQFAIDYGDTQWKRGDKSMERLRDPNISDIARNVVVANQVAKYETYLREKRGVSPEAIRVWKLHRASYDKALDLMTAQLRELVKQMGEGETTPQTKTTLKELKEALASMNEWRGFYAPRLRERGQWVVQAERPSGERYRNHTSKLGANRLAEKLKTQGWTNVTITEASKLPETVYQNLKAVDIAKAIKDASQGMKGEAAAIFNEDLIESVSNLIKGRGFRGSMIHRGKGDVVQGYMTDPLERYTTYVNNQAGGFSKAQVAQKATQLLLGEYGKDGKLIGGIDAAKESRVYTTAQRYMAEQLRNLDYTDKIVGIAKSIATFKYLGFNPRSMLVNLTALGTTVPPALHQYAMGGKGSMTKVTAVLTKASADTVLIMGKKKLKNADEQAFIDRIQKEGYTDAQLTRDAMGKIDKIHKRLWSKAMAAAMWMFGKTEEFNRTATMLAGYRLAKATGKDNQQAYETAIDASNKAHGLYGRSTLPAWAQGGNVAAKAGQMMYVYGKFGHNYLQMMYDLGFKKHDMKAFFWGFLSPLILAGGSAWPLKDLMFGFIDIIRKLLGYGKQPLEKVIYDSIRHRFGAKAELAARHGVTGLAGIDISGSLSIGVGIPKTIWEVTGAAGSIPVDFWKAGEFALTGQPGRAAEKMLPTGVSNILRSEREKNHGVFSESGHPLINDSGRLVKLNPAQAALRAAGFRPSEQAVLTERRQEHRDLVKTFENKRDNIYKQARAYFADPGRSTAGMTKLMQAQMEYNQSIRDADLTGLVPFMKYSSIRDQGRNLHKLSKSERYRLSRDRADDEE